MSYSEFSTDNAVYVQVHTHHGSAHGNDMSLLGGLAKRLSRKAYPTMERPLSYAHIGDLDGIVLENYEASNEPSLVDNSQQYRLILKSLHDSNAQVPLYLLDVYVKDDYKKMIGYANGFGLMFLASAVGIGSFVAVKSEQKKTKKRLVGELEEVQENYEVDKSFLELEIADIKENNHGWVNELDARLKLSRLEDEMKLLELRYKADKYRLTETPSVKKTSERKDMSRRNMLKLLGIGGAYALVGGYMVGGHLVWPYALGFHRGKASKAGQYMIYLQTEMFPTTTINLRNAIWAKKIEEVIALRLKKKLGRKPRIAVISGVMHAGLQQYLQDKSKRNKVLKDYQEQLWKISPKNLEGILELLPARGHFGGRVWRSKLLKADFDVL